MTRRVYIYFIVTFLLGIIVGGAGMCFYGWHWGHWPGHPERRGLVAFLARELKLSTAQATQLDQIMAESRQKYDAVRERVEPEFDAIRKDTDNRIRQILTPEQLAKFNDMVRHFEEHRKERPR
jgi:Spy/CpxP family protein refolding chaperone